MPGPGSSMARAAEMKAPVRHAVAMRPEHGTGGKIGVEVDGVDVATDSGKQCDVALFDQAE